MRKLTCLFLLAGIVPVFTVKKVAANDVPFGRPIETTGGKSLKTVATKYLFAGGNHWSNILIGSVADTTIMPKPTGEVDTKVSISNGEEAIEITPLSSLNNGAVLEPVNRVTGKGVNTSFYLSDSSDWKFYTNKKERLKINGDGDIITSTPLLINNAEPDPNTVLRVNGNALFDEGLTLKTPGDTSSFISFHPDIKNVAAKLSEDDKPYTTTPTVWANGKNIPGFRLRHPGKKDFMILPYEFGTAIEYNGVVECWVGEWSIHRGLDYFDVEGKGNGWGGVMWVGDDHDTGGLRATSRDNVPVGGNVQYGELSVERFTGLPLGDLRFRLPSNNHAFQFIYGERGSTNIVAKVTDKGLFLPKVATVSTIANPEKAQLVFDSSSNQLKAYDGTNWVSLTDNLKTGSTTVSSNGSAVSINIVHGLAAAPSYFNVLAASADAGNIRYVSANATHLTVHYNIAPAAGLSNLTYNWQVKR